MPVAHVEAGLRSFDRRMPEELNRVIADHLSTWLFAPTPRPSQPGRRGHPRRRRLVGDLMQDLAARVAAEVATRGTGGDRRRAASSRSRPAAIFATVHRAENRDPDAMRAWSSLLASVAADRPVVLALHPGTAAALEGAGIRLADGVHVVAPQGYRTTLTLQLHAAAVLTDSGGVQREAAWLRTPCLILRDRTEWVEAVAESEGRMVIVGLDEELALRRAGAARRPARGTGARRRAGADPGPGAGRRGRGDQRGLGAEHGMSGRDAPPAPGRDVRRERHRARQPCAP